MVAHSAKIIVVCGGSGSGKSAWVKQQLRQAQHRRRLVWDVCDEYQGHAVRDRAGLVAAMRPGAAPGRGAVRYVPPVVDAGEFDFFCRVAWAAAGAGPLTVVVEELADVTSPGKAPPAWGLLVRRGRHRAMCLFGITQRPAESDKTIIGNHTLIHCAAMKRADDRRYMAREMGLDQSALDSLAPLQWIETAGNGSAPKRGKMTFRKPR